MKQSLTLLKSKARIALVNEFPLENARIFSDIGSVSYSTPKSTRIPREGPLAKHESESCSVVSDSLRPPGL